MKAWLVYLRLLHRQSLLVLVSFSLALAWILSGCSALFTQESPALKATALELRVQQTLAAQQQTSQDSQATDQALNLTQQAQAAANLPTLQPEATIDIAQAAQQTVQALQNAQATLPVDATVAPIPTEEPTVSVDMMTAMKSAQILLYEDMVKALDTNRYVKDTLDSMGLPYTDVGNAVGWLKSQVSSGAPNGKPWDLVIIAIEQKTGYGSEFFEYVLNSLDKGSSVIFETFFLDRYSGSSASTLLSKCGVAFDKNWYHVPPERMVMFPLDPTEPFLRDPNVVTFTSSTTYWYAPKEDIDVGDWVTVVGGDAKLLVGTIASDKMSHGTVTLCFQRRLVMQTFSSHALTFKSMTLVWQNYIYNLLKERLAGTQP